MARACLNGKTDMLLLDAKIGQLEHVGCMAVLGCNEWYEPTSSLLQHQEIFFNLGATCVSKPFILANNREPTFL